MRKRARDRKEATFIEHLEELRKRLIRCVAYVAVGAALCWIVKEDLMAIAQAPIRHAAEMKGVEVDFKLFEVAAGLVVSVQIALVAGLIMASPGWLLEAWRFIEPALEDHERKWVVLLLPGAVGLFLGGVAFCYWLAPRAFAVLIGFQLQLGIENPELMLKEYLTFFLRLMLIFGVMFELPLVIMFLSAVGIVKSSWLAQYWRIAIVIIALVCAIVTPTPDAVTLTFLAGPMIGLYMLSILLARMVEKGRAKSRADAAEAAGSDASAPVVDAAPDYQPPEDPHPEYQDYAEPDPVPADDEPDTEQSDSADTEEHPSDEATGEPENAIADDVEQLGDAYEQPAEDDSEAEDTDPT